MVDASIDAGFKQEAAMAESSMSSIGSGADPFAARGGWVTSIAARVGMTEGQLYSVVIGVLLAWVVSANALPSVVWDQPDASTPARQPQQVASAPRPSAPATETTPDVGPFGAPEPQLDAAVPAGGGTSSPVAATPSAASEQSEEDPGPVRVTGGGYASASAGTPLATFGVPGGSVAVSRRAGSTEKVAYLRLAGRGSSLDLAIDSAGSNTAEPLAGLQLCVVTDVDWTVGHGDTALADAPAMDCTRAIAGVRAADGSNWSFDVSALDVENIPGVAIVPAADALLPEFQVVFKIGQEEGQ